MRLLITDLDNTLYDWVTFFAKSFAAMSKELSRLLDVDEGLVLQQFRAVHQSHGNSEHPFAILELPVVKEYFGDMPQRQLLNELARPLEAFNSVRRRELRLYPGVAETLRLLKESNHTIVAHTEAIMANAYYRLRKLEIAQYFSHIYALEGTYRGHPLPERERALRPPEGLIQIVPKAERKPNPDLLRHICGKENVALSDAWYVGDSLGQDISMAKAAGVRAVWARYGTRYDHRLWDVLVRVTHWTPEDVARAERLREAAKGIAPDDTIDSFDEILKLTEIESQAQVPATANQYEALWRHPGQSALRAASSSSASSSGSRGGAVRRRSSISSR